MWALGPARWCFRPGSGSPAWSGSTRNLGPGWASAVARSGRRWPRGPGRRAAGPPGARRAAPRSFFGRGPYSFAAAVGPRVQTTRIVAVAVVGRSRRRLVASAQQIDRETACECLSSERPSVECEGADRDCCSRRLTGPEAAIYLFDRPPAWPIRGHGYISLPGLSRDVSGFIARAEPWNEEDLRGSRKRTI